MGATGTLTRFLGRRTSLKGTPPGQGVKANQAKDQSYFMFGISQEQLDWGVLPIGHVNKDEVRRNAANEWLPSADKAESQEIGFVPDGDYASLMERESGTADLSGPVVGRDGRTVVNHQGIRRYTVVQRKGLGSADSPR